MTAETRALENVLISNLDGHDLSLPPLLPIAESVLAQLGDPNCALLDVAETLAGDPVMAAAVIRMANSPLYRGLEKTTALPPAVTRLGVRALRTLMINESMRSVAASCRHADPELADLIWRRSLASAVIMRGLAPLCGVNQEEAFLIGLLHDIGHVMVLRVVNAHQRIAGHLIDLPIFEHLAHECHQVFGELLADAWKLPPGIKGLIADHHAGPPAHDPQRTERWMLLATDMICALLNYAPSAPYDLLRSRPVQELGLSDRRAFLDYLRRLPEELQETLAAV
jgi:HD-like signal output (HDOD) protein